MTLANEFAARCEQPIHIVAVEGSGPNRKFLSSSVQIIDLDERRVRSALVPLVRYLRHWKPSVLLATMSHANLVASTAHALARSDAKLILREANIFQPEGPTTGLAAGLLGAAKIRSLRWAYSRADALIANSEDTADSLQYWGVARGSAPVVIHNPIQMQMEALNSPHQAVGDAVRAPRVLAVGRLAPQKGFETLIESFTRSNASTRGQLTIVGEGPLRSRLEALISSLSMSDRIFLPGYVDDIGAVYRSSDLLVSSSRWEGFGNVLVEAMAYGVPVVSTNAPGGPCEILEQGRYGRIVPVGDIPAMSEAIDAELVTPTSTREARIARSQDFAAARIARQYMGVCGVDC